MKLQLKAEDPKDISHFMELVSAYKCSKETILSLTNAVEEAIDKANDFGQSFIVDHDRKDFFFVVHPTGIIDLCTVLGTYDMIKETKDKE